MDLLTADDPRVGAVLATDTDAGVQHDGHQEARLALGEAVLRDRLDALDATSRQQLLGEPRIDAAPASSGRPETTQTGADSSIAGESGADLRRRVSATVVRRDDLDVLDGAAAVTVLVFDPRIRELHVPVVVRQLVLLRPSSHSLRDLAPAVSPRSRRARFSACRNR